MAQAVSRRPLAAEARDRSQATPCEDCGGQSGTETGFPPRTSVVPCEYYPTNAPHWSSSASCSYRKDKGAKPGNLPKKRCSLGNRRDGHQSSFISLSLFFNGWRPCVLISQNLMPNNQFCWKCVTRSSKHKEPSRMDISYFLNGANDFRYKFKLYDKLRTTQLVKKFHVFITGP